jgi:hypothetical protein
MSMLTAHVKSHQNIKKNCLSTVFLKSLSEELIVRQSNDSNTSAQNPNICAALMLTYEP